jgi:hypothetical protein
LRKNGLKISKKLNVYGQCSQFQSDHSQLFSSDNLESIAKEHGFIKRSRKISASDFVKTLVFSEEDHEHLSLLDLKCDYLENSNCKISQEAIHKRFTPEAVSFLKDVFSKQLNNHLKFDDSPVFKSNLFTGINIKDSSKFNLPVTYKDSYPSYGSYNIISSLMNIQYEYDLLTGNWLSLELTKATRNDQTDSKETVSNIKKGSLNIRDLGYITSSYLKKFEFNEAYYLNRLPKIGVYQKDNDQYNAIDWQKLDNKMKQGKLNCMEMDVYLGEKLKLKSRLVITPVPEDVKNERMRKANKSGKRTKGYKPSKEYKIKAGYNIFISNTTEEQLTVKELIDAYRLRWQIELIFKTWKSNLRINRVKPMKKERMECQLIAKLIWILLSSKILQIANYALKNNDADLGCSPTKFFKRAKKYNQVIKSIIEGVFPFYDWFMITIVPIIPYLIVEQRLKEFTHCQILTNISKCLS